MPELPAIFAGRRRWMLIRLVINGTLQAIMIVGAMLLVRHAFDVMLNPAYDDPEVHLYDMSDVWQVGLFAIGMLSCTGTAAWLRLIERVDAERMGQEYVHQVRMRIYDCMGRFAPRALNRRSTGAATLRFVGDLSAMRRWVSLGLARIIVSSIISLLALGFMASLDVYLAVCSLFILIIGLGGNLLLGPRMHQTVNEVRRLRGRLAGNVNEKIRAFIVIQAFDQIRRERRRLSRQSRKLREAMIERARATGRMRVLTDGATAVSMGLVLSLGALEVFNGSSSAGNVVAAMAVVGFLSTAFRDLGRVHEYNQSYRVSKAKIISFINTEPMKGRSASLPALKTTSGVVEFRNIRLKGVLRGISGTIPAGARIALVGPNGSGKSTLLYIASRLIDPDAGRVLIDGQNIRRCSLTSVRRSIGVISPDMPLLRGSVRYNLRYRLPNATDDEVARVSELCKIDDLLSRLPEGEKYRLQEGGQNLSLGQRHRLVIARALLGNPPLLIIDEIDANLDPEAVTVLDRVIESYSGTLLMVTRNQERLARADQIWYLERGRLVKMEPISIRSEQTEMACEA